MNTDYLQNIVRAMKNPYACNPMQQPFLGTNPYCLPGTTWPCGETAEVKLIKELTKKVDDLLAQVKALTPPQAPAAGTGGYMNSRRGYYS